MPLILCMIQTQCTVNFFGIFTHLEADRDSIGSSVMLLKIIMILLISH